MFRRLANMIKGFFSLFISGIEKSNPRALIEAEKENLRRQISQFNESLASQGAFVARLMRQVKTLEQKEKELAAKISANIKVGNRGVAGQLALNLQTVKDQLAENQEQLVTAEETYQKLIKTRDVSVQEAKQKIEKLKRMISETEMLEAQAELQEMAAGMITEIGGSGDTLNRVQEYLEERKDQAEGRARVASTGIDTSEVELKEAEQNALAEQALAEFESAYGFASPKAIESPSEEKEEETPVVTPAMEKELGPRQ